MNTQPKEPIVHNDGDVLDIVGVWRTIQGEGPLVGTPAVFVRTAGCNYLCLGCDTQYTKGRYLYSLQDLVYAVQAESRTGLVVLTGGEPFRQPIGRLVRKLTLLGYQVQIETNGSVYQPDFPYNMASIVCSPKTPTIPTDLKPHIGALKYVVQDGKIDPADGLPTDVLGTGLAPARPWPGFPPSSIFVQPVDELADDPTDVKRNTANLRAALTVCYQFGYRLSLQTHKIIGVP